MASQTYVDSVTLSSAAEWNKWDTAAYAALSGVAGTNTITATGPANLGLVATNPPLWFIPAATNTGATTLNITPSGGAALGAKNVFFGGSACVGGELVAGVPVAVVYDGTQYNLIGISTRIFLGTEVASTSGTAIDFTGIPARTRRIKINFRGVSLNGTANILIQIGDAGGIENTVYISTSFTTAAVDSTAGFIITSGAAAATISGTYTLSLEDASDFTWIGSGVVKLSTGTVAMAAGEKALSAELTQVRITTTNGTDTFDAGAINISYER